MTPARRSRRGEAPRPVSVRDGAAGALILTLMVYRLLCGFPESEMKGLPQISLPPKSRQRSQGGDRLRTRPSPRTLDGWLAHDVSATKSATHSSGQRNLFNCVIHAACINE